MDFIQGQETLTVIEWILRAVVAYIFLVIVAKVLGQRAISQLRLLDFVIALVIGNVIAHPLSDERLGLEGSLITTIVLVVLYILSVYCILKFPSVRRLVNPAPIVLVRNGDILVNGLKKARISIDVLLEELREAKVDDFKKVAIAFWEADGKISVFMHPKFEPINPVSLNIEAEPFSFPKIIIKEGKLNYDELKQIGRDENWIASVLKNSYQTVVKDVMLATYDNKRQPESKFI